LRRRHGGANTLVEIAFLGDALRDPALQQQLVHAARLALLIEQIVDEMDHDVVAVDQVGVNRRLLRPPPVGTQRLATAERRRLA
jgi:hypothetical protein